MIVIVIMVLLTGIILASLGGAKNKGNDSAVIADMSNVALNAETLFDDLGQRYSTVGSALYSADCSSITTNSNPTHIFQDVGINNSLLQAKSHSGGNSECHINTNGSAYTVASPLKSGGAFCIDSSRAARSTNSSGVAYDSVSGGATPAYSNNLQTICN